MTILSDIEIEALCVLPKTTFDAVAYDRAYDSCFKDKTVWVDGEQAKADALDKKDFRRSLTADERSAFVPMITPFSPQLIRKEIIQVPVDLGTHKSTMTVSGHQRRIISRGLTSYGYDVSLASKGVKLFTNINSTEIDPKRFDESCLVDATVKTDVDGALYVVLPPNSYLLGHTNEYFRMPRDTIAVCLGKSTYARAGVLVNVTPIEPGFEGNVVIEVGNSTGLPVRIYLEEGISQFLFFQGAQPCRTSYGDRGGKYQGQTGVTLPKV